ncbi:MAG: cache domain-containing protein, partial [Clostridiaceae bacterium]|nr:cache domain-containing protein [Clostridiaceae bacterium]
MFSKKSVVISWILSYILIFAVPLSLSAIMYGQSLSNLKKEILRANESMLLQVQGSVDERLIELQKTSSLIGLNKTIMDFAEINRTDSGEAVYNMTNISRVLAEIDTSNDFVERIYVFYKMSNFAVGSNSSLSGDNFFAALKSGESYKDLTSFWSRGYNTFVLLPGNQNIPKSVAYLQSISRSGFSNPEILIAYIIREEAILQNLRRLPMLDYSRVLILDKEGSFVGRTSKVETDTLIRYQDLINEKGNYEQDKYDNVISYVTSSVSGWKYISVTEKSVFWKSQNNSLKLLYLNIFLCIIIGGLLSYFFIRRNYNPVAKLTIALKESVGKPLSKNYNEFKFIQDAITSTMDDKKSAEMRLRMQNNMLRSNFLNSLMKGRLNNKIPVFESMENYEIKVYSEKYAVILFSIDECSEFVPEKGASDYAENYKLMQFSITNVVEELAGQNNVGYMTEIDEMLACLVNFKDGFEDVDVCQAELRRIANETLKFFELHFKIKMTASISKVHATHDDISAAYQEALDSLEYRVVLGNGVIISYESIFNDKEIEINRGFYNYPISQEQQLINKIKVGDKKGALEVLSLVFHNGITSTKLPVYITRCLMFDLASTMLKAMDDIGELDDPKAMELFNKTQQLTKFDTVNTMKHQMNELLENVCEFVIERQGAGSNKLIENI